MPIEAGQQLLHYRLVAKIGEGGVGVVWKATDTRLDRTVAIKVLRHQLSDDARVRERFEREARTISNLNHPHICTLHDIGHQAPSTGSGRAIDFIVMEHLEGEVLADRIEKGALPMEQALRHGIEIAGALHEAHQAGMVHRDLKPGNIMLTRRGIKLMDFGLAKMMVHPRATAETADISTAETVEQPLTMMGMLVGTVPYMAPEQLEGKETDARTDIFALGSVLHEMVTGRRAFTGTSQASLISAIMMAEAAPVGEWQPAAPPLLDDLIRRCLAKNPNDRWQSALDLAGELERIAQSGKPEFTQPKLRTLSTADYRIEYFKSPDGASIAAARGGSGPPLFVVPTMVDSIEASWGVYAKAFADHELITYDRRGCGLSERGSMPARPEPYLHDAQAVVDGFGLESFDVLGTLLGSTEAAWLASRNADWVEHVVLRAPIIALGDWASIPGVRAALAAMEHDWKYFTESFSQFVVGWGNPNAPKMAERIRTITSRKELRALIDAFVKLDLMASYGQIQAPTLVEHHPGYFFPDTYSRRIASMIQDCRMAIFSGADGEFIADLTIARAFLSGE